MKRLTCIIAMLLALCVLAGCSAGAFSKPPATNPPEEEIRIGVSLLTTQLEYYVSLFENYRAYAKETGVELIIYDSKWDRYKQSSDIRKLINEDVDAIICSPTDPATVYEDLLAAQEAGIKVIVEMTYIDDAFTLVSTNQYEGGRLAGEFAGNWINQNYNGNCDIAILGYTMFDNTVQRQSGFIAGVTEVCPSANIVAIADGQAKSETSYQVTLDILSEHPNVRCVFGINDDTARGINKAFHFTRLSPEDVCVIGFDADVSTQQLIDAGNEYLKASVSANPSIIAKCCIDNAILMTQGKSVEQWIEVTDAQFMYTGKDSAPQE